MDSKDLVVVVVSKPVPQPLSTTEQIQERGYKSIAPTPKEKLDKPFTCRDIAHLLAGGAILVGFFAVTIWAFIDFNLTITNYVMACWWMSWIPYSIGESRWRRICWYWWSWTDSTDLVQEAQIRKRLREDIDYAEAEMHWRFLTRPLEVEPSVL